MNPKLSVIIVTWRAAEAAARALQTLMDARSEDAILAQAEVIVVDNDSGDGTAERLARQFPAVRVIPRATNGGFGVGVNEGIRQARGEYLLLMNPDCELLPQDGGRSLVEELVQHLDENPQAAAVGPALADQGGNVEGRGRSFPAPLLELRRQLGPRWPQSWRWEDSAGQKLSVDWISGACMLLRREALIDIGTFDERFFLYWEETDWCRRARRADWEIHHRCDLKLLHIGGVSAAASGGSQESGCLSDHFRRSRRLYFRKHHGSMATLAVDMLHIALRWRSQWATLSVREEVVS